MKNVRYINASAGSGKTYTLTHKLADLIKDDKVKPEEVIMTTFTDKAATEMKEKAKAVLCEEGLYDAASKLDQALIGTVHSVANSLIKKYWFFLELSPDMGVMKEEDKQFYISQSLSDIPESDELWKLLRFCEEFEIQKVYEEGKSGGLDYDFWKEDIKKVIDYTTNYEIGDYEKSVEESLNYIQQLVDPDAKVEHNENELKEVLNECDSCTGDKTKKKTIEELRKEVKAPTIRWYGKLERLLNDGNKGLATMKSFKGDKYPKVAAFSEELKQLWRTEKLYESEKEYIELLFKLATRWREQYSDYKKERNLLDFNDMEKYLRDLLENEEVKKEIQSEYKYLFVDEYQDCSPIQVKIFDALSELMEHSYWVGDYKQAIYGFRGSDITLTKSVVDRIAKGEDGCDTETLDTSYRSLPGIVTACNETFKKTFDGVLDEGAIVLKANRENTNKESTRYWRIPKKDGRKKNDEDNDISVSIADHVARLIDSGVEPVDIAILARENKDFNNIVTDLSGYNIPISRGEQTIKETRTKALVFALLALVVNERDTMARATVATLAEQGYGTKEIIEGKIDNDTAGKGDGEYLGDVELIKQVVAIRKELRQQSVGALIETMVIELDLYNEAKKIGDTGDVAQSLDCLIAAGHEYEEHCLQMSLSATINGYMDYVEEVNPQVVGDVNGVQLMTYHGSKGLEWKYVILTSLGDKKDDANDIAKKQVYGVHFRYTEQPSAEKSYPEVYIRVMPFVYGVGNTKIPEDIQGIIERTDLYKEVRDRYLQEENRLLYVGMTRPQDVMIMALEKGDKSLQWLNDVGLTSVNPGADKDILGIGVDFEDDTMKPKDADEIRNSYTYTSGEEEMKRKRVPYKGERKDAEGKYQSPSGQKGKGKVEDHAVIGKRIAIGTLPKGKEMKDVGDCIHQIFCGIESNKEDERYYEGLIKSYGLEGNLKDTTAIKAAWENLVGWLEKTYGKATKVYHERPFRLLKDGKEYNGSIDLVWQTAEGDVLIDFKTCPMGEKVVLDENNEKHFVGQYAGQLDAYEAALVAAGEKVVARYIYYPVSGLICKIGKCEK